jgi:hypothetical protein
MRRAPEARVPELMGFLIFEDNGSFSSEAVGKWQVPR